MSEEPSKIPPKPTEPAADGYIWFYDGKMWREVEAEIRGLGDPPFFTAETPPHKLPEDGNPPKKPNPN